MLFIPCNSVRATGWYSKPKRDGRPIALQGRRASSKACHHALFRPRWPALSHNLHHHHNHHRTCWPTDWQYLLCSSLSLLASLCSAEQRLPRQLPDAARIPSSAFGHFRPARGSNLHDPLPFPALQHLQYLLVHDPVRRRPFYVSNGLYENDLLSAHRYTAFIEVLEFLRVWSECA